MCGIIGYIGENNAVPYLIEGLKKLEYRGYDSSGIALQKEDGIFLLKRQGKISELIKALPTDLFSFCGIGHTRWATHGEASARNAHPHMSKSGIFALVHNGIIENSSPIKEILESEGYSFVSDTDTEVVCHLLERNYKGDVLKCIGETVASLEGSYALAIIHKDYPDTIYCAKKNSPLLISTCPHGSFVFSDCVAADSCCEEYFTLDDGDLAIVKTNSVSFFDSDCSPIEKKHRPITCKDTDSEKMGFDHYMLKEIYEQPSAFYETIKSCCNNGKIDFPLAKISAKDMESIDSIHIVGCGSAYHAGVYGKYIIEELTGICTSVHIASEFRYGSVPLSKRSLVVVISQSGETADSIAALKKAKDNHAKTLAIVNVQGSTMTSLADMLIYTKAGKEIAVATTKAYLCQIAVLYLLGVFLGEKAARIPPQEYSDLLKGLWELRSIIENQLRINDKTLEIARNLTDSEHIYFIGRHTDYALALEGALKMKEISYIHCEAYPAGELKHGTISLIEKGTPVVAVCLREDVFTKTLSNIKEVKARGGQIIAITRERFVSEFDSDDTLIVSENVSDNRLTPLTGIIPLQLLSYHVASLKGCEVDKPRNLAKSVTVE